MAENPSTSSEETPTPANTSSQMNSSTSSEESPTSANTSSQMDHMSEIKILIWNVNGLKRRRTSIQEFNAKEKFDIMCLTETRLYAAESDSLYKFKGFTSYKKERESGGVACMFSDHNTHYESREIPNMSTNILWVLAHPKWPEYAQMIFGVIYNPPTKDASEEDILIILEREYKQLVRLHPDAKFILGGDFNACTDTHLMKERDYVQKEDSLINERICEKEHRIKNPIYTGKMLLGFCQRTGFRIANGRFGDESARLTTAAHVLDYVLCREKDWGIISTFKVNEDFCTSNHKPLILTLQIFTKGINFKYFIASMTNLRQNNIDLHEYDIVWGYESGPCLNSNLKQFQPTTETNTKVSHVFWKSYLQYSFHDISKPEPESDVLVSVASQSAPLAVQQILCFNVNFSNNPYYEQIASSASKVRSKYCVSNYPGSKLTYKCLLPNCSFEHLQNKITTSTTECKITHQENIKTIECKIRKTNDNGSKIAELQSEIEKLQSEKEKLQSEIEKPLSEIEKLLSEKEKLLSEKEKLLYEKEKLLSEKEKLLYEKEKLQSERAELRSERAELRSERAELQKNINATEQQRRIYLERIKTHETMIEQLRKEITTNESKINAAEYTITLHVRCTNNI